MKNIFETPVDFGTLMTKEQIIIAIYNHYGYNVTGFNADGSAIYTKRPGAREFQLPVGGLNIRRHNYFEALHYGAVVGKQSFAIASTSQLVSNWNTINHPDDKLFVAGGMMIREGAGVVGALQGAVVYATPAEETYTNGTIKMSVNNRIVLKEQRVGLLFNNDDVLNNFVRFAEPMIIEPNEAIDLVHKATAAVGDFWYEVSLHGYLLEK